MPKELFNFYDSYHCKRSIIRKPILFNAAIPINRALSMQHCFIKEFSMRHKTPIATCLNTLNTMPSNARSKQQIHKTLHELS